MKTALSIIGVIALVIVIGYIALRVYGYLKYMFG